MPGLCPAHPPAPGTAVIDHIASLFVSHGAPTIALEDRPARHFLHSLGATLVRPRAIVAVTAHWETDEVQVASGARPATIHDFFGFPQALFDMRYDASGDAALAHDIAARLQAAGIAARCDDSRGFDHGTWIPLACMYPAADIPVVQVSVCPAQSPLFHFRVGRALAGLRHDNVLVMGSGSVTHNLADFRAQRGTAQAEHTPPYCEQFCEWLAARIAAGDSDAVLGYRDCAPHGARAHPSPEHFLPLHVALGAAGVSWSGERLHHSYMYGVVAMDAYAFRSGHAAVH
ncbi:MAG: dioxygenase [Proteobacteria bacterium]|nr:dioxygenase [Pseudomonadota bacterium]